MDRLWPRRIAGIFLSAAATGIACVLATISLRIVQGRWTDLWWFENLFDVLAFILVCGVLALPAHAANALAMLLLRKIGHDSLPAACLAGGSLGLIWFASLALLTFATAWPDLFDVVAGFLVAAVPAGLYWCFVVRKERAVARRLAQSAEAITAMD